MKIGLLLLSSLCVGPLCAQTTETSSPTKQEQPPNDPVVGQDPGALAPLEGEAVPPPPPPPDGLLPVTELTRFEYTSRDRPKPLLQGNHLLVVSPSGFVEGFDAQTGEFAWKLGLPGEELFDPVVFEPAEPEDPVERAEPGNPSEPAEPAEPAAAEGDGSFKILLSEPSGHILVIDGPTGEIEREAQLPFELALPPVRGPEDILFLATPSGDILAYSLGAQEVVFQTATAEVPLALSSTDSLLIVSGGDQTITAIDLPAGTVRWTFRGRAAFHAPAAFDEAGERVYIGDDTGEFQALDARNGKVKFHWSTGASIRSQALVENERVYVATFANTLYAFHARSGDEHWRAYLPGRPATPPLRVSERLMLATFDGVLIEINPQRGVMGKQYQAPGEVVYAPSFYLARPTAEELAATAALDDEPTEIADGEEDEHGVLSEEDELPAVTYVPAADDTLEAEAGFVEEDAAPDTGLDLVEPATTDEEAVPREPLWFERSRIALALRSGQVLLLHHQAPDLTPVGGDEALEEPGPADPSQPPKRPTAEPSKPVPF